MPPRSGPVASVFSSSGVWTSRQQQMRDTEATAMTLRRSLARRFARQVARERSMRTFDVGPVSTLSRSCRAPPAQHYGHRTDRSFRNCGPGNVAHDRRPQTGALLKLLTAGTVSWSLLHLNFKPSSMRRGSLDCAVTAGIVADSLADDGATGCENLVHHRGVFLSRGLCSKPCRTSPTHAFPGDIVHIFDGDR